LPGEKILIVDDEKNIATLIELHLEMEGYKISIAYDGATAFERLSEYTPDLIILDIMMPRMDGWELCRELKGNRKFSDIPVIMLTAKSHKDDIKKGWNLGVADYITKPFSPVRLVEVIKRVLLSKKEAGISLKETRRPDYPDGVNIGVLGSSEAGISIIQFLLGDSRVNIRGVAGIDPDSPVMHLAKKLDIFSTTDIREFLAIKDLQIVFILSENEELKGILEKAGNYIPGAVLDLTLEEIITKNGSTEDVWSRRLSELVAKVNIDFNLEDSLKGHGVYSVARIHNNQIQIIECKYVDGKLSFDTDMFSKYVVLYSDTASNPNTSDRVNIIWYSAFIITSATGYGYCKFRRRRINE